MKQDIWNYVAKHSIKLLNNLKVATLCFVDSAANPWPSLNELHDVVT